MEWLEHFKRDMDYINVYGRMRHKPEEIVDQGDYFYCVDEDDWFMTNLMDRDKIIEILKSLGLKEYGFPGVITDQYELFDPSEIPWEEHCYLYYYDGALPEVDGQTKVRQLSDEDAKIMNEYYTYQSEDSIDYIKSIIKNSLAFGIEVDGKLVSWVVQHLDGSMGIMYTLKDYRRLGFADILTKHLIREVMLQGDVPYIHIEVSNEKSMALAEKNGFKRYKKVVWFGLKID